MTRALLVGNYGTGNFGDEAFLAYFKQAYPEVSWTIVSAQPTKDELPRLPLGIRSFFTQWWRTINAIRQTDIVVFGGGTLFTDAESLYAPILWWYHAFVCRVLRTPYTLAFQGIGPFRFGLSRLLTRWVIRHARFISVRDDASLKFADIWKKNKKIVQSFDPVYSLYYKEKTDDSTKNVFIIIPRNATNAMFLEQAKNVHNDRQVAVFQPDNIREQNVAAYFSEQLSSPIIPIRTAQDIDEVFGSASHVLTQRYHGAVIAHAYGIPFTAVPQVENDKLSLFTDMTKRHSREELLELVRNGEDALRKVLTTIPT